MLPSSLCHEWQMAMLLYLCVCVCARAEGDALNNQAAPSPSPLDPYASVAAQHTESCQKCIINASITVLCIHSDRRLPPCVVCNIVPSQVQRFARPMFAYWLHNSMLRSVFPLYMSAFAIFLSSKYDLVIGNDKYECIREIERKWALAHVIPKPFDE